MVAVTSSSWRRREMIQVVDLLLRGFWNQIMTPFLEKNWSLQSMSQTMGFQWEVFGICTIAPETREKWCSRLRRSISRPVAPTPRDP